MERIDVRIRARAPADEAAPETVRERVRAALRCPFCRDEAPPLQGALACARRGCGALYHDECWAECAATYGGCAVYGCGSRAARGVGRAGLLLRVARLVVAAALFPRRALEALRTTGQDADAARRALREHADHVVRLMWTHELPERQREQGLAWFLAYPLKVAVLAAAYALVLGLALGGRVTPFEALALVVLLPVAFVLSTFLATRPVALGLRFARAVLAGEFAALDRASQGTVLSRLRAAVPKGP